MLYFPVPQILQNPELPNGCEITSLCMLLRYWGYDADKCVLADRYLPRTETWWGTDPDLAYMGNPHLEDDSPACGYYCFAGPIVAAATAYLADQEGSMRIRPADLTGAGEEELIACLQQGCPFLFWASLHFDDICFDPCGAYPLPGGREHRVFHQLAASAVYEDLPPARFPRCHFDSDPVIPLCLPLDKSEFLYIMHFSTLLNCMLCNTTLKEILCTVLSGLLCLLFLPLFWR